MGLEFLIENEIYVCMPVEESKDRWLLLRGMPVKDVSGFLNKSRENSQHSFQVFHVVIRQ
jgi:hypothetical protein